MDGAMDDHWQLRRAAFEIPSLANARFAAAVHSLPESDFVVLTHNRTAATIFRPGSTSCSEANMDQRYWVAPMLILAIDQKPRLVPYRLRHRRLPDFVGPLCKTLQFRCGESRIAIPLQTVFFVSCSYTPPRRGIVQFPLSNCKI